MPGMSDQLRSRLANCSPSNSNHRESDFGSRHLETSSVTREGVIFFLFCGGWGGLFFFCFVVVGGALKYS